MNPPSDSSAPLEMRRRGGWWMIAVGWGIALALAVLFFNGALSPNPNRLGDIARQDDDGPLLLSINSEGQYLAEGHINHARVTFLLDTGATLVAVPQHIARRAGLKPEGRMVVQTANGNTVAARAVIDNIRIGHLVFSRLQAAILPDGGDTVLLGMNALKHLHIIQQDGTLRLQIDEF